MVSSFLCFEIRILKQRLYKSGQKTG